MPVKVRTSGPPVGRTKWTVENMRIVALASHAAISLRTFNHGRGIDGAAFAAYAETPIKIYARSSTGRRLSPKGGEPFKWVWGPKKRTGGYDESKIGMEAGKFYAGGYSEYKKSSRLGLASSTGRTGAEVDLVLSGRMSRGFRVLSVSRLKASIGITGSAREYGHYVDQKRPWIGLSSEDEDGIETVIVELMRDSEMVRRPNISINIKRSEE